MTGQYLYKDYKYISPITNCNSVFGYSDFPAELIDYLVNKINKLYIKEECNGEYHGCGHETGYNNLHYPLFSFKFTLYEDSSIYDVGGDFEVQLRDRWDCKLQIDNLICKRDGFNVPFELGMFCGTKNEDMESDDYYYQRVYLIRDSQDVLQVHNGDMIMTFEEVAKKMKPLKMVQMILCYLDTDIVTSGK